MFTANENMISVVLWRTAKAAAAISVAYFVLPRLRDAALHKLQPLLMRQFHHNVQGMKNSLFHILENYSREEVRTDQSLRIVEIGAADGLNLPNYPPGSRVIVLEPYAGFRPAFENRLAQVNASREGAHNDIILEAWYTVVGEELAELNKPNSSGETASEYWSNDQFDVAVSTFTLCTVTNMEQVLRGLTKVVKPGGLLLILEHVRPENTITRIVSIVVQPLWYWLFGGCYLSREPHRILKTNAEFYQSWDIVFCQVGDVESSSRLNPVRHCVALAARKRS